METLSIKYEDTDPVCALNTEKMAWLESGKTDRTYVSAFRVYYVIGKPAFEIIGKYLQIQLLGLITQCILFIMLYVQ